MLSVASAQKLTVESMTVAGNDISARQYRVNDLNGQPCALVKVQLATRGAKFAGSVIGTPEFKNGVYWVYMPAGVKELEVQHDNFVPCHVTFGDYGIQPLQSLTTYVLTLLMPQGGTAEPVKLQKLTINYSPANAMVLIDSQPYQGNGRLELELPIGSHDYQIVAMGYIANSGSVNLTSSVPRTITETLTKAEPVQQSTVQQSTVQQSDNVQSAAATQSTSSTLSAVPSSASVSGAAVETFTVNGVSFNMVRVDGGTFTMGATSEQGRDAKDSEKVHIKLASGNIMTWSTYHDRKIKERLRALLVSGILIALKNERFKAEYKNYKTTSELVTNLFNSIKTQLEDSDVPDANKKSLVKGYEFITTNNSINNPSAEGKIYLTDLISTCDERINGFDVTHRYIDTISQFYIEFLRYANNDKGLGIVLTPPHITELFCELAEVDKNSVVLDNCAGTGGFLVSAMKRMLEDANGDISKERDIKKRQLVGIEYDEEIYTLLISNMIVHRDGRTNITHGDCFAVDTDAIRQKFHPTVGLLNPPYKNKGKGTEELEFVLNNLSMLEKGGRCVAIMPMSCVNDVTGKSYVLKKEILQEHTLEAVLSLPEDLFHNSKVNTVTCAVVLTAHIPYSDRKKTWFGYCRDDGFVKRKNKGRVDANHVWDEVKDKWVTAFINREVIPEFSVMRHVSADDEWCAEAYLETAYDRMTEADYLETVKNFYLFSMNNNADTDDNEEEED